MTITLNSLNLGAPTQGKAPPIHATIDRPLTAEDISVLALHKAPPTTYAPIKALRTFHHHIARLVSEGRKDSEISALMGVAPSTLWRYHNDPSFKELVAHYQSHENSAFAAMREKMATLGEAAAEVLLERVLEDSENIEAKDMLKIMNSAVDRSGQAPAKTQVDVHQHHHFPEDEVAAMKAEIIENRKTQTHTRDWRQEPAEDATYAKETSLPAPKDSGANSVPIVIDGSGIPTKSPQGKSGSGSSI